MCLSLLSTLFQWNWNLLVITEVTIWQNKHVLLLAWLNNKTEILYMHFGGCIFEFIKYKHTLTEQLMITLKKPSENLEAKQS